MANLTADREDLRQDGILVQYPVAATKLYKGSLVCTNAAGYAAKAADTAAFFLAGIAYEQVDNSSGAAGDKKIRVWRKGIFEFNGSGFTQADVGKKVHASDDNTVALTTTNSVVVGRITEFVSATKVRVEISPV